MQGEVSDRLKVRWGMGANVISFNQMNGNERGGLNAGNDAEEGSGW